MSTWQSTYVDRVGVPTRPEGQRLSTLDEVPAPVRSALQRYYGADLALTPPQQAAVALGLIQGNPDMLVSAPTNSGKTLIALLRVFTDVIRHKGRSVYVVPLKALAEEKLIEFTQIAELVAESGGPKISIAITTGDYQLTEDFLGSSPPDAGEIVICTPERIEVMLRNGENYKWAEAVSTYVIDEFHLLGDARRGATFETLLTRLLVSCPWSCMLCLSATVGGCAHIQKWFERNGRTLELIESEFRYPPLQREIVACNDKSAFIRSAAAAVLAAEQESLLIFVDTKRNAAALAADLAAGSPVAGTVSHFHAGLSLNDKRRRIEAFRDRRIRVMVTTTSLKMGVNFPVTQVIVRDTVLRDEAGAKPLSASDVLQMIGRAGRGDTEGRGLVLCMDAEEAEKYAGHLASGHIEELRPRLLPLAGSSLARRARTDSGPAVDPLNSMVLTELALRGQATPEELAAFVGRSYSSSRAGAQGVDVRRVLEGLERDKLIFKKEGSENTYCPTLLGKTVSLCGISPESGAMLAAFLRALIRLSEKSKEQEKPMSYLRRLHDVDLLFLASASFEARDNWVSLPRPGKVREKALSGLQEYLETLDPEQKPLVNLWRSEHSGDYPTRRLLSSLKVPFETDKPGDAEATFGRIMRTAILLHRHSRGAKLVVLAEEYGAPEGNLESGLKSTVTWVLNCLAQICDSRKCYKLDALKMRLLELMENLTLGATLGMLLQVDRVGRRTVAKLIENGIDTLEKVAACKGAQMIEMGIGAEQANRIVSFMKRRNR